MSLLHFPGVTQKQPLIKMVYKWLYLVSFSIALLTSNNRFLSLEVRRNPLLRQTYFQGSVLLLGENTLRQEDLFFKLFHNEGKLYLLMFDNGSWCSCFISANLETMSRKEAKSFVTCVLYSCKAALKSLGRSSRNT